MADYSSYKACGCSDYSSKHRVECVKHPDYPRAEFGRQNGLDPVYDFSEFGGGGLKYFECKRGCGCLVWDAKEHIKNVCREFKPTVGE